MNPIITLMQLHEVSAALDNAQILLDLARAEAPRHAEIQEMLFNQQIEINHHRNEVAHLLITIPQSN